MATDDSMQTEKQVPVEGEQAASAAEVHEDSEELLRRIREKYRRKQDRLDELKKEEKKTRAAAIFTRRRYREVAAALRKGGNMISEAALTAQKESVKLLDRAKAQARVCGLNAKIDGYFADLGSEIYDCVALGVADVFDNANVKKTLGSLNECHVEIELIGKKIRKEERP